MAEMETFNDDTAKTGALLATEGCQPSSKGARVRISGGTVAMTASDTRRANGAVWSFESARLVAGPERIMRGVDLAEELAQDALVAALGQWPESGVPDSPLACSWPSRSNGRSIKVG
jgi:hypothetical protein